MRREVLIVVHQETSDPGKVGRYLAARGARLDRRCPCAGDPLPADLSPYAALVVFGGPQSANDDHLPGIRAELDWLERRAIPSGLPLLGICLGAQQIARVLGARVGPHHAGQVEIGYYEIAPTPLAGRFLERPTWFYQWHRETFDIPSGATHLAASDGFPGQAFRHGEHVHAIEFHPEMTREMVARWATPEPGEPPGPYPGARPDHTHLADYDRHAAESDRWLARFIDECLLLEPGPDREIGRD